MKRFRWVLILTLVGVGGCSHETDPAYIAHIDQWHAGRVEGLRREDGWLTLVGLHPLHAGVNLLGSGEGTDVRLITKAPQQVGAITIGPGQILFAAHPGVEVFQQESESAEPVVSREIQSDNPGPPTILRTGSLLFHVIARGDLKFLRVKDTQAEVLQHFEGIDRFPVDDRWRVTARIEAGPATIKVPNVLGQIDEVASPGILVFKIKGRAYRLTPQGVPGEGLFIVFGDNTNGQTTYAGGRFLSTEPPAPDGTVVLDFNRATNPPCVFTSYATCPLPSVDNLLDVAVEAGEKMWGAPH